MVLKRYHQYNLKQEFCKGENAKMMETIFQGDTSIWNKLYR